MASLPGVPAVVVGAITPPLRAARVGAFAAGVVLLLLGALAYTSAGTPGAVPPDQAARAGPGPLLVAGTIELVWVSTQPTTTHVTLAGAPSLDVTAAGDLRADLQAGMFVAVRGTKEGNVLRASSVEPALDPAAEALAPAAGGTFLLLALLLDRVVGRGLAPAALVDPMRALRLRRGGAGSGPGEPPAGGAPDNHSGAPAPKG